jgi:chromosome segregation ATPase
MKKISRKKRTTSRTTVTSITLQHINEKLEHIHKDLEQNSKDISQLKQQMAMGKGGLKVIFYVGGVVSIILGVLKIGKFV